MFCTRYFVLQRAGTLPGTCCDCKVGTGYRNALMTAAAERQDSFILFVNGTLMRGLALHANLDGATFIAEACTAPCYRLFSIDDIHPGMYEVSEGGVSVAGELYDVPWDVWRRVEAGEPPNLYRGPVKMSDGTLEWGILFPPESILPRHRDISEFASWRTYQNRNGKRV